MNRKIILSAISIVTALSMMGASAFAQFTTSATATGNTFSSGTEHLQISTDNTTFHDTIVNPFNGSNITQGYSKTTTFYLLNDNTHSSDDLTVTATFKNGTADVALDNALITQFTCTNSDSTVTTPSPFNITAMRGGSVGLGVVKSGLKATCSLTVTMPSGDSSLAGKTTSFDVEFDATQ